MRRVNPSVPGRAAGPGLALVLVAAPVCAQTPQAPPTQPPAQAANRADGFDVERLFATSCGWCHQDGGRAEGRGPKLAGTDKTDEYIANRIRNGRPPGMPAFGRSFNDAQIQAMVAYIRGLQDAR